MNRDVASSSASDQDWLWIENFQEGDRSAFDQIFNKYKTTVVNLAFRFVRARETAEDITQEVFIKIYEKKVRFEPKTKFSTWLYRVTVNTSLDALRKRKMFPLSLDERIENQKGDKKPLIEKLTDPRATSPLQSLEEGELKMMVQGEVEKLPEKLRLPILLSQFENLPQREIALILGITEKAVEKRIYHAKERLRKRLLKYL